MENKLEASLVRSKMVTTSTSRAPQQEAHTMMAYSLTRSTAVVMALAMKRSLFAASQLVDL